MTVVPDSGVWISAFHFAGVPLATIDRAFLSDKIAFCDPIISEVTTILTSKFGWSSTDASSAIDSYLKERYPRRA
jgi:hypothetical protein